MNPKFSNNHKTEGTIELQVPQNLKDNQIERIAAEHGTLCIRFKGVIIRNTFYKYDIDRTLSAFIDKAHSLFQPPLTESGGYIRTKDYDTIDQIQDYVYTNWLVLIGKVDCK